MYYIAIYNDQLQTIIHYPSSNQDDPHVTSIPLAKQLSAVGSVSFKLYPDNPGYNKVKELKTRVKVFDVRDNTIEFTGRIFNIEERMDSDGKIYKDISCECALSYLNDTKQRGSSYASTNGSTFISEILANHNSKVDDSRKIYLGNVDVTKGVSHTCNYKTTLAEIIETVNEYKGFIRVRETDNKLYLDWLSSFENSTLDVSLGVNMKEIIKTKDITEMGSRIIPLGANNLTIESVNGGKDYIDDINTINEYGVIEKIVQYNDIEKASDLLKKCKEDLSNHTQIGYTLKTTALDLSYLTGVKAEQFKLGTKIRIENKFMNIDDIYTINKITVDLTTPYNPTLEITNKTHDLTNTIQDIKNDSIQNNGVYNNVQIGSSFGIRAVRSDQKVITTINATDGITIENKNKKVFYVDTSGVLNVIEVHAEGGEFNNITCTDGLKIEDGSLSCLINALGIELIGQNGKKANIQIIDDGQYSGVYIRDDCYVEDVLRVFGLSRFEKRATFYDGLTVTGIMRYQGQSLEDYITDIVDSKISSNQ